jgi:hypothetical protein
VWQKILRGPKKRPPQRVIICGLNISIDEYNDLIDEQANLLDERIIMMKIT